MFCCVVLFFLFQAEDGIRDIGVTGVQTCALPIYMLEGWIAHYNSSFDIERNNRDRAVPDEGVQVRGALGDGLLCLFLFRDIRHQDIEGDEPAVCVRAANRGTLYPSNEVVLPDDPDVKDRGIFPMKQVLHQGEGSRAIFLVNHWEQKTGISRELFRSVPRQGFATGAEQRTDELPIHELNATNKVRHRPHQAAIAPFALL